MASHHHHHHASLSSYLLLLLLILNPSHQSHLHNTTENPKLAKAYTALQSWKRTITSDPLGFTSNWNGPQVCNYTGIYCAPHPDDPFTVTVAGVDINGANISGSLPEELGLLADLAVFHINSNHFNGTLPTKAFVSMTLLFELDVSNNHLSGTFPDDGVVSSLPSSLRYLDLRFNDFHGNVPSRLFDMKLDAVLINDNKFQFVLPENMGNSPASVIVMANNDLKGCSIPSSVGKMKDTLNEIIVSNTGLSGCLPEEIGELVNLTVFDMSSNNLVGSLPESMAAMKSLEVLNMARNNFSGEIPVGLCLLPSLENFTYAYNFFSMEPPECAELPVNDDRENCIPETPLQRSDEECNTTRQVDCGASI